MRDEQSLKANFWICVTYYGIYIVLILIHPLNAYSSIIFKCCGKIIYYKFLQFLKEPFVIFYIFYGNVIDTKFSQFKKAYFPIYLTVFGILIFYNFQQFKKTSFSILSKF